MKKKAKPIAKNRVLAKRSRIPMDLLARAGVKKGLAVTTSKLYFQPIIPLERVLWNVKRDKAGNVLTTKPYATYDLLVDNLHRRGVLAIEPEELPPVKCKDRGCYNAGENDIQHRFRTVITLENGQRFVGHGEACKHNTTRITRSACPRMAETRSKARPMRDATNIGIACVLEIDNFQGGWFQGKAELSQRDVEEQVDRTVRQNDETAHTGSRAALPAPGEAATAEKDVTPKDDKAKAMAELHAVAHDQKVNTIGLHAWIHKKANVASLTDLNALALKRWADDLRKLEGDALTAFQQNCIALASGGEVKS